MSETSDMWDRFFRGSKYEWKRKAIQAAADRGNALAKPIRAPFGAERGPVVTPEVARAAQGN